jgi:hypothetical protein
MCAELAIMNCVLQNPSYKRAELAMMHEYSKTRDIAFRADNDVLLNPSYMRAELANDEWVLQNLSYMRAELAIMKGVL